MLASAADHAAIYQFLTAVFQGPSREAFHASLDDPFYEPRDRILVKMGSQIVSHALLSRRVMYLAGVQIPVMEVSWLATLPEYRGQGHARRVLEALEQVMVEDGSPLAVLRTRVPHFFHRAGWVLCGRHSHSTATTRGLLTKLPQPPPRPSKHAVNVRPWRQVELPGLMRLYDGHAARTPGAYERTEAYWRWLISRKEFEHIFVAAQGIGKMDLDDAGASITGYAIMREEEILELVVSPECPETGPLLLARACREAIERDYHTIHYHSRPDDPLHDLFVQSGGKRCYEEAHQGEVFMVRLPDPMGLLGQFREELHRRAVESGLPQRCELGLLVDGKKYRLVASPRGVKLKADKIGRSYLSCNRAEMTRLVLGHMDVDEALERGRVDVSTRIALEAARALFPRLPTWRSPLDQQAQVK